MKASPSVDTAFTYAVNKSEKVYETLYMQLV